MQTQLGLSPETTTNSGSLRRADTLLGAVLAAMFGVLIIGVVGFSHIDALHNAAHDVRHSNGFPCH